MTPIKHPEENFEWGVSPDMGDDVVPLSVQTRVGDLGGVPCNISQSLWQPTDAERKIIADGGNIILEVFGTGHPPIYVTACEQ